MHFTIFSMYVHDMYTKHVKKRKEKTSKSCFFLSVSSILSFAQCTHSNSLRLILCFFFSGWKYVFKLVFARACACMIEARNLISMKIVIDSQSKKTVVVYYGRIFFSETRKNNHFERYFSLALLNRRGPTHSRQSPLFVPQFDNSAHS